MPYIIIGLGLVFVGYGSLLLVGKSRAPKADYLDLTPERRDLLLRAERESQQRMAQDLL